MFRVWLVICGISGFLWAVEDDTRFTCPDKMLEMTEAALGERAGTFHLATEMVRQLSSRPAFRGRFQTLLALHELLSTDPALIEALSRKLAQHTYSIRSSLVQDALQETGRSIPAEGRLLLSAALETFPLAEDPSDPNAIERRKRQTDQVLSSVSDSELVALYQSWRLDDSSAGLKNGATFLDLKTMEQFKAMVRNKNQAEKVYQSYRKALLVYIQAKVNRFFSVIKPSEVSARQAQTEFELYLIELNVAEKARPLFTRLMHAGSVYAPDLSVAKVQATLCAWVVSAMAELRRELLLVQRQECETASDRPGSQDSSVGGGASGKADRSRCPAGRPARSRRRAIQEQVQAEVPLVEQAPASPVEGELSEEQIEALFSRMSPTVTHYSKLLRALDEARRKLTLRQFLKFRSNIVSALRNLEAGVPPLQAGGLYRAERGVWELRPLGTSTTHRFFIGQIDSLFFILCLCSDVKSGRDKEHKLIIGLEQEVRAMQRDLDETL
jgi:hypothetical protein